MPRVPRVLLVVLSFWMLGRLPTAEAQDAQKAVLVLYGVGREAQLAVVGDRELPQVLREGLSASVDYYSEYMDVARLAESDYQAAFREFLQLKYAEHTFDAVIAMGDVSLDFLATHRDGLFGGTPIVFFSSRAEPRRLPNSTGVMVPLELTGTLDLALRLQPDLRSIVVVSGAAGTESEKAARAQFASLTSRFDFSYLSGLPIRDLETRLSSLPPQSAVYYLVVDRDGDNRNFNPLEYLDRMTTLAGAPVYSWVDSAIGHGIVGGSLKSQAEQARAVGAVALRVLRGEVADRIPISTPNLNTVQVDWRQLQRWQLSESRVPLGAVIAFRPPSVWDRYRVYIIGALSVLIAQTTLIAALLVQRRRLRHAEERVQSGQEALRASSGRIRDLGGRLLQAQDAERARLARELHDDISQQLALLEIDLELLKYRAPDTGAANDALDRARSVARSVHDLSHRLHPAKLRLIGLVAALEGLVREISQAGPTITFTHSGVPTSLAPDVTVCLFRVAQEALQNAAKHSGAQHVALHLGGTPNQLTLSIADDGAGFDVNAAWGRGLGLLSMEERVEAAGGRFDLTSSEDEGTRVAVTVPLGAESA